MSACEHEWLPASQGTSTCRHCGKTITVEQLAAAMPPGTIDQFFRTGEVPDAPAFPPDENGLTDEGRVHLVESGQLPGSSATAEELGLVPYDKPEIAASSGSPSGVAPGALEVEHEIQRQLIERMGIEWPPGEPFYALIEDEIVRLRLEVETLRGELRES